jgi:hypothetical protein
VTDTAADSELLDGLDSAAFQRSFNRIVVVRTASELVNAVQAATTGSLIKLEPGTYNIGSNVLDVPNGTAGTARIASTRLEGGVAPGAATCAGVWDGDFTFFAGTCPHLSRSGPFRGAR